MTQQTKQHKQETAKTKRTPSASTEALITAKCALSDLYSDILNALELSHGKEQADGRYNEIGDAMNPLRELIDCYLIESIDCNIGVLDSTEF